MAIYSPYPSQEIMKAKQKLYTYGVEVEQETWQSMPSPDNTLELLNYHLCFAIPMDREFLVSEVKPNLPWADVHFDERVSGIPFNPPPSASLWPFNPKSSEFRNTENMYSHTYPERFWPKVAGNYSSDELKKLSPEVRGKLLLTHRGIRFNYGDLEDVVNLLIKYPHTRQAFIPIWFPEDTGAVSNQRVPCSIGYDLIMRKGFLHMSYYIRSCDIIRHFRDDIYLAVKLLYYVMDRMNGELLTDEVILPGSFNMYIKSLHCFSKEREILKQSNI